MTTNKLWDSAEHGASDGDGGDRGSLSAKDAWAEGDWLPGMGGEEIDLFGGPAALGADGERDVLEFGRSKCGGLSTALRFGRDDGGQWRRFGRDDGGWGRPCFGRVER